MPTRTDLQIATTAEMRSIGALAETLGLSDRDVERYGDHKAKLTAEAMRRLNERDADGTLVLVTGTTPTTKGEGKTVVTIGLGQALSALGEHVTVAIREPSLGPVFGMKGGAAGGGYSQVLPMEDINLHFTGDIHAITAAHNLLAAMLDAHIHHGNALDIDVNRVRWKRALDVNDRALRDIVIGLGGTANGIPRETGFEITAASELMAILGLADDLRDLKARIERIVVAYDRDDEPVTAADIGAAGAMTILLRDALRPNLVGTIEGTPAFVHGGPFANIAHGTNTLVADRAGLALADYLVTEVGFAADLGAEKFVDIVSRRGITPDVGVLVTTVRSLKCHGLDMWPPDYDRLAEPDVEAVRAGFVNLDRHVDILRTFGLPVAVAVNRFPDDTEAELEAIRDHCDELGVEAAVADVYRNGGDGGRELANAVRDVAERDEADVVPLYEVSASIPEKIETVATEVYGATDVEYTDDAREAIDRLERNEFDELPVCISKTPYSLSDDPYRKGAPTDWTLTVREIYPSVGAGFIVALTGDVLTMPGLPAEPAAMRMDIDEMGEIEGLF